MASSDTPAVTAIIPVYNGERFLDAAIRSVLEQTRADLECVVVDDGSVDETSEVVERFDDPRLRYVYQANAGVSSARNAGLDVARGHFVAFLDADDIWLPHKVERQLEVFRRNPGLGLLVSGYIIVDEVLHPVAVVMPDREELDLRRLLLLEAAGIGLSFTGMVSTAMARAVGFDSGLSTSADLAFALAIRDQAPVHAVLEPLSLYRVHVNQMHLNLQAFEQDMHRVFDRWLPQNSRDRDRGIANLYTRLFFYELSRWNPSAAWRAARLAVRHDPSRLVALPGWAAVSRLRRRRVTRRWI